MSSGGQSGGGPPQQQAKNNRQAAGCVTVLVLLFVVVPVLWGLYDSGVFHPDKPQVKPVFGAREQGRLVERLANSFKAQGICYGWVIDSDRPKPVQTVTPSYRGTFRPEAVRPSTSPSATPSPMKKTRETPEPTATRTKRQDPSATGTRTPRPDRTRASGRTPAPRPSTSRSERDREGRPDQVRVDDVERDRIVRLLQQDGVEYGSNLGSRVDPRLSPDRCDKWLVMVADYFWYTSEDDWGSGDVEFETNVPALSEMDEYDLRRVLGQTATDDGINGDRPVARLADYVGAMPMYVAQEGVAPYVPAPTVQAAPPPGDELAGPGLGRKIFIGIGIVLIAGAVLWITVAAVRNRRSTSS